MDIHDISQRDKAGPSTCATIRNAEVSGGSVSIPATAI